MQAIDKKSFETIFRSYYTILCNTAYRIVKDRDDAEDIVQHVFCLLWGQRDSLEIRQSVLAYLSRSVINHSLNKVRAKGNQVKREDSFGLMTYSERNYTQDSIDLKELQKTVDKVINILPEACRLVFVLSRYEKLSYREIAEKLNISVKTVENHMVKALRHMRKYLSTVAFAIFYLLNRGNLF
ncbi:RNA polymerase sigma-70 factor [Pseudopedobacter sp.]|uniref:RNA polymerase sigma-70 factor n=1 Tax=Pseudopedobacter sp. TaxID=1936787 RepID=UPI003340407C